MSSNPVGACPCGLPSAVAHAGPLRAAAVLHEHPLLRHLPPPHHCIRPPLSHQNALEATVHAMALRRLEFEGEVGCAAVTAPGRFFGQPLQYALATYAYYLCSRCEVRRRMRVRAPLPRRTRGTGRCARACRVPHVQVGRTCVAVSGALHSFSRAFLHRWCIARAASPGGLLPGSVPRAVGDALPLPHLPH
jgi:hypothetical protein